MKETTFILPPLPSNMSRELLITKLDKNQTIDDNNILITEKIENDDEKTIFKTLIVFTDEKMFISPPNNKDMNYIFKKQKKVLLIIKISTNYK